MWRLSLRSLDEYVTWAQACSAVLAERRKRELELERRLPRGRVGRVRAYCAVCRAMRTFSYDWLYGDEHINWRERLACNSCRLNSRLRLAMTLAGEGGEPFRSPAYLTEQTSSIARLLSRQNPLLTCSEFLGAHHPSGLINEKGVRHENLTALSFADEAFNLVLSFDVLEHIFDYRTALREVRRVLRPGGRFILTVPMHLGSADNVVRACLRPDGTVEHLLPPEFHEDAMTPGQGILCVYHFGWTLVAEMHDAGFSDAAVELFWSWELAHFGPELSVVVGIA